MDFKEARTGTASKTNLSSGYLGTQGGGLRATSSWYEARRIFNVRNSPLIFFL